VHRAGSGHGTWTLGLDIRLEENGPTVAHERVEPADLDEVRGELWRESCLRSGAAHVPIDALEVRLEPVASAGDPTRWSGFALEVTGGVPDALRGRRCAFSVRSLHHVALRAVQRLVTNGVLQATDLYYYEIAARREAPTSPQGPAGDAPFRMTTSARPLDPLHVPLGPLRRSARPVETGMEPAVATRSLFPVFYTEDALVRAERLARRGQERRPPVETGGVLVGPVGVCPESGELFAVVTDVIEAAGAEEGELTLTYSGRTWQRVQAVVRAIRSREGCASHRPLGQVHGHNFLPADGAPPCAHCARVTHCTRTSVFVSNADADWSRAVFCRQPWTLCHIFGLNARGESVQGLFGWEDGRLRRRAFEVIDAFDPLDPERSSRAAVRRDR
jgi:hypothetical protein